MKHLVVLVTLIIQWDDVYVAYMIILQVNITI
jgi:hypothetical protein